MKEFRFACYSIFLLIILNGCFQSFHKTPVSPDTETAQPAKDVTTIQEPPLKTEHPAPQPSWANIHSETPEQEPDSQLDNPAETMPPEQTDVTETAVSEPEKKTEVIVKDTPVLTKNQIIPPPKVEIKILDQPIKKAEPFLSPKNIQALLDEALDFCQAAQDFWEKGELENAFEALDQAYSLILKIDDKGIKPELIQQKEDLRFLISKRILEIYASRNIVVNGKHNEIPLVTNKYVQAEIDLFTTGKEKDFFTESYRRSGQYRSKIVSALKEAGLPSELSWLPLIESGFKAHALSRARALGLWQFIPSTGYKFGLKRDTYVDERLDPEKSTTAAIAYLKELHQIFGDWTTVLAAYNCGEGKVLQVIRDQNVNYLDNFWDLYERLPLETARYVPRFLATLYILKNSEKYGFDAITLDPAVEYKIVPIEKQVHLKDIAAAIGTNQSILKQLNPELRYQISPPEKYSLKVPPDKCDLLLSKLNEIPTSSRPRPAYITHKVRPGETLSSIASKYQTSITKIAQANNIYKHNLIIAGKTLKIPQRGIITYRPEKQPSISAPRPSVHIVNSGDSLWILAKRYGTTTKEIEELNNLSTTRLHIGQVLKMPGAKTETLSSNSLKTYLVKRGDSPFKIAQKYKMPLEQFLRINQLTPRSKIYPGQELFIE